MNAGPFSRRRIALYAGSALAGLAVGIAGVLMTGWGAGNGGAPDRCDQAVARAAALKPLATGEMAAFAPAERPIDLAGLAYQDVAGAPRGLADHKGKAVLLNLWATWCAPCREEMPALDRLAATRGSADFAVVTLNSDVGDPQKPAAFLKEHALVNLADDRDPKMSVFNDLKTRGLAFGLPTTLLIDGEGCQMGVLHGPAAWDSPEALALIEAAIAARSPAPRS